MKICVSGPRPGSLGNAYRWKDKKRIKLRNFMLIQLEKLLADNPDEDRFIFYDGMALGIDQDFFSVVLELKKKYPDKDIKLIAAVPFRNQYKIWKSETDKSRYFTFLDKADEVIYVDELEGTKYYSEPSNDTKDIGHKLKMRNKYMVDHIDVLFAYPLKESKPYSGTINCIKYANKKERKIVMIKLEFK